MKIYDQISTFEVNGDFPNIEDWDEILQTECDIKVDGREFSSADFLEFAEAVEDSHLDVGAILAYADNLGLDWDAETVSKAEEDYQGQFDDDAAFAQDMAEQMGDIDKDVRWPYTCIDWDDAAKELMYDYFEQDGYYFRNS